MSAEEAGQTPETEQDDEDVANLGLITKSDSDRVGERFRVEFDRPMDQFDTPTASAFSAVDEKNRQPMLALVCKPRTAFRTRPLRAIQGRPLPGVAPIRDSGMVVNPLTAERALAIIMDMPEGGPFITNENELRGSATERDVIESVMPAILVSIENLLIRSVVHRNIRPTNLWYMDRERQQLSLGDCVTAPPGFSQPIVYEPIERMMASKSGRGFGTHADDVYAMGVTMISLLIGRSPALGRNDETLIAHKLMLGTFTALTGNERFLQPLTQLLRGMVADTPSERWPADYIRAWRDGRIMKTRRSLPDQKATAPIKFLNKEYFYRRQLSHGMSNRPDEAGSFMRARKIDPWLRRNLEDARASESITYLVGSSGEGVRSAADHLTLTQVLYHLDPWGPLGYRGLHFCFDGIGPVIAEAYVQSDYDKLHILKTLISRGIIERWINYKSEFLELSLNVEIFAQMARTLQDAELGRGMERLLYDLNPSIPCLSEPLWASNSLSIRAVLMAMNELAETSIEAKLIDKHSVAFICSRSRKVEDQFRAWSRSKELGSIARDLGVLALLAHAQRESNAPPLSSLTRWAVNRMQSVLEAYHSRQRRERIAKRLNGVVKKGDLMTLLDMLGNPTTRTKDETEYKEAVIEYSEMETEISNLEMDDQTRRRLAVRVGHRIANGTSYGILILSFFYTLLG